MIFMTNRPRQIIEGVQFLNMGQQGVLGRYPIHFHILGDVPGTICRKNTIQKSHQVSNISPKYLHFISIFF